MFFLVLAVTIIICHVNVIAFVVPIQHRLQSVKISLNTMAKTQAQSFLKYPLTQVVSDIDDTLKSSGGVKIGGVALGGIDVQYDRGEFYPGVFQFMWELSLYSVKLNQRYYEEHAYEKEGGNILLTKLTPPKVAVLTAVSSLQAT